MPADRRSSSRCDTTSRSSGERLDPETWRRVARAGAWRPERTPGRGTGSHVRRTGDPANAQGRRSRAACRRGTRDAACTTERAHWSVRHGEHTRMSGFAAPDSESLPVRAERARAAVARRSDVAARAERPHPGPSVARAERGTTEVGFVQPDAVRRNKPSPVAAHRWDWRGGTLVASQSSLARAMNGRDPWVCKRPRQQDCRLPLPSPLAWL